MNLKKTLVSLVAAVGMLSCGLMQPQKAAAAMNKNQVINIVKKDASKVTSGKLNADMNFKVAKQPTTIKADGDFGGNPLVSHINYSINTDGKTQNNEMWIDTKNKVTYTKHDDAWVKSATSNDAMLDSVTNSALSKKNSSFYKQLAKKGKLTRDGDSYVLTATINQKKQLKKLFASMAKQYLNQGQYQQLEKHFSFGLYHIKVTVTGEKLTSYQVKFSAKYGKTYSLAATVAVSDFGKNNQLAIPANVLAAAQLPAAVPYK
ncbi:hypothetical protein PT285_03070 [Lactobacillus sp. ESL0791]|uniref:DUF6612 family protein n=1 Tax=Lactobacillus sp. ESL0791 TaxID=2983234 RepID=UPI0023F9204E|nr:DUF6612 family protein [Lactobacillus sp. ESL0791]MDF7638416.1 hypothetical protein [Lactobacillus sp. ESL0791]